ncbi:MAG: outer membrane beta-barrel protein [Candidatus Aminicenantes bacterium]|nr:outer membrane beta-barrel protein [Candidatus Aminicenantes bacterium]
MKKVGILTLLVLALATAGVAQNLTRFELNLFGGYGLTNVKGATNYGDSWSSYALTSVQESTTIDATSKGGMFFGGGLAYYFHPNIGVGVNFGYLKAAIDTTAAASFYWRWNDGRNFTYTFDYVGTDNFIQSMPISFNLIARFGQGNLQGYVQAGPTLYMNKIKLDSAIAYGVTEIGLYQYVDALQIPVSIDQSWTKIGADFGAGLTFWFSPAIGLSLEARYFLCPKQILDWSFGLGNYDGYFFGTINMDFDQDSADYVIENGLISQIEINPSFFQFGLGVKIRLY